MPEPVLDFNFYAGGIEDGILEVLTTPLKAIGVKSFATYSGELDSEKALKDAISQSLLKYPFVMVSYAGGASANNPPTSRTDHKPRHHRHECTFSVIVADNTPQGDRDRRRGQIYKMISAVWETLVGVRLVKEVDGEHYVLNVDPFDEPENVRINIPNVTAFGIIFDTAFRWTSPDRTPDGTNVTELIVGVESLNASGTALPSESPGVKTAVVS